MDIKKLLCIGLLSSAMALTGVMLAPGDAAAQQIQVTTIRAGRGGTPRYHVAVSGDTLYDLARRYYGDPLEWPRLWSYNPQITNPHWIYPGDVIFLRPPGDPEDAQSYVDGGLYFPLAGFYTTTEFEVAGTLRFANTDRGMLSILDEVYVEFEEDTNPRPGDEYVINRVVDRIEDEDGETAAIEYEVVGRIHVVRDHEETDLWTCEVVQVFDVIERDDVLFVNTPQLLVVHPRENTTDLEGEIVDHIRPVRFMHEQDYVFIDLGYSDGVRAGNRLFIWQRRDEGAYITSLRNRHVDYEEDVVPQIPWQLAGEMMVIYTSQYYATAVITDGENHEIEDGQRVTMQRGY